MKSQKQLWSSKQAESNTVKSENLYKSYSELDL
jgi:hypothetical protein